MAKKFKPLVSIWKKHGKGKEYRSMYLRDVNGERVFVLSALRKNGTVHNVTFESYVSARNNGWVRIVPK